MLSRQVSNEAVSTMARLNEILEHNLGVNAVPHPSGYGYRLIKAQVTMLDGREFPLIEDIPANHIDIGHYQEIGLHSWLHQSSEICNLMQTAAYPIKLGTREMDWIEKHPLFQVLFAATAADNQVVIDFLVDEMAGLATRNKLYGSYRMPSRDRIIEGARLKVEAARKRGEV